MSTTRVSQDKILESIQAGPGNAPSGAATVQNEGAWPRDTIELSRLIHAGRLTLREETEGTGVVSSLAIIRKHIAELESAQVETFTRGLGSLLEYLSSNHFRSGVVLSQNSKILDWLAKAFKENPAFLPGPSPITLGVLKLIAWIAATMRYNNAAEKKIKELIYPRTFQLVEQLLEYKSRGSPIGRNQRLALSIRDEDDDDEIEERFCEIEEIDNWFGFGIYTLMIMEKFLALPGVEFPPSLPGRLLDLLVFFCQHFPSVAVSEVRTTILNSINSLMKAVIPQMDRVQAAQRIGDLMMISLVFQQKTDFVYSLQSFIEEVITQEPEQARVELQSLQDDERTFRRKILKNCTKMRSLLFSYLILTKSSPELARLFFNRGGRAIYMQMLYDCIKQNKVPKIYIFLKDEEVLQHTTKREEQMLLEITNRINDSAVKYQLVEELSLFTRTIINRRLAGESHQSEYTTFSKVFKEKETAEVVMNGLVSNFWKEGKGDQPENKNLVIEVKQNAKRKALEVDLTSPGAGSAKSFNSWFSQKSDSAKQPTSTEALPEVLDSVNQGLDAGEQAEPSLVVPHVVNGEVATELGQRERHKHFKATLYSYDIRRELGSKDVKNLRETFFSYDRRSNKMKLFKGKTDIRVVYHRRLVNKRGLYFGVFEIDDPNSDYMYLDGIVYSPNMRRIFVTVPIKRFQRNQQGGTPYYEQDFVTLCTTTTPQGARDHLIVMIDKSGSKYKLLYNSLQLRRKSAKEFPHFESIFTSWSVNLDSYRSFSLASGNDHVLIGCKHLLAVFQATHGELAFKHVIADTGFGIARIRLLDYQTSTFILFGYASREFNIVNIASKKIYNFIFEWLQASQAITEVELDKNLMVYLVEDRKRRKSSVFFREETQHLPVGPQPEAIEGMMEESAEAPRLPLSTIFSKGPEPDS